MCGVVRNRNTAESYILLHIARLVLETRNQKRVTILDGELALQFAVGIILLSPLSKGIYEEKEGVCQSQSRRIPGECTRRVRALPSGNEPTKVTNVTWGIFLVL